MKKLYILLFLFASLSIQSMAQMGQSYITLNYSTSIGLSDTHDDISKFSFRGASFEYRNFVTSDVFALGFDFNWNVLYDDKPYGTYQYQTVTLTGNMDRSLNLLPFMLTADYFLADNDHVLQPYIGFGLGPVHSIENVDMGLYRYNNKEWHFGIKPQIGLWYYLNETTKLSLSSELVYAFKTKDTDARQLATFNIGFAFTPY